MKKILLILLFLLSNNAYANNEIVYLSCPKVVTKDSTTPKKYRYPNDFLMGQIFFEIKKTFNSNDDLKKMQIKEYYIGFKNKEEWPEGKKPKLGGTAKTGKSKKSIRFKDGSTDVFDFIIQSTLYEINKSNDTYSYKGITKGKIEDVKIDYTHGSVCDIQSKKGFKKQ